MLDETTYSSFIITESGRKSQGKTRETFFQYCKHMEDNKAGTSHTAIMLNTTSLATVFSNRSANSS